MSLNSFKNRIHAGRMLADKLTHYANRRDVIVLGLPRGGVPVAAEIAARLQAPLDVMVVRKLGMPGHEELAMGAIASGGVRVLHDLVIQTYGISKSDIERVARRELQELHRREFAYRGHTGTPEIQGRIVIIVDDGIATGSTIHAAVLALRQQAPERIIIAVPVSSTDGADMLQPMVDEFIALLTPDNFRAVGQWYQDFGQTSDEEVQRLLAHSAETTATQRHTS